MKLRIALAFALSIFAVAAQAEKIVLTGATLIDPARNEVRDPSTNTDVNIDGDRIAGIGQKIRPALARVIDCKGKFILPGYIDTHVHFFQSGDLFTRPDVVDLTKVRPYADEVAWIKKNLPDTFERYLRSGITSVVDVGGPFWNFEVRKTAKAVEDGADVLVHSVIDKPVDDAFVKLLQDRHTILCPTLVVFERYGRTFANKLNLTLEEKAWGNPEVIATLDVTKVPRDQLPDRIKTALAKPDDALDRIKKIYDVALKNLKTLEDAGVTIAAGTDAGNIGKLFGGETGAHIGKIDNGNFADLIILKSNPIDDIAHASDIDSVMKNGVLYPAQELVTGTR